MPRFCSAGARKNSDISRVVIISSKRSKMNGLHVSVAFTFLSLIASAPAVSPTTSVFVLNGKSYLNEEYEVVTKNNVINIINGELQGVISKRKLTEEEQRTVKEAKEKMDKEMADTVIEQQKLKQQIQQQISDDVQKTLSFWQNINWPLGWLRPAWF